MTIEDKGTFSEKLDEIIQSIEVKSAIAIQKSMQDGDAKHHKEFVAQSRKVILDLIEREVIGEDVDVHDLENPSFNEMRYQAAALGMNNLRAEMRAKLRGAGDEA